MLYLLDANTLIEAKNQYFKFQRVPEFWAWLVYQGTLSNIKLPVEVYDELADKTTKQEDRDELTSWINDADVKEALLLEEEAEPDRVARVTYGGYTPNPTDAEIEKMGADPILVSYALSDVENRTIVTVEKSKPSRQGANRHIPDVCNSLNIRCINTFRLLDELDFSTNWESKISR